MDSLIGGYLHFLHGIRRHRWLEITLQAWLILLLVAPMPLALVGAIPGGFGLIGVLLIAIVSLLLSQAWARRRYYVHFRPHVRVANPSSSAAQERDGLAPAPLWPQNKLLLRATGHFAVEGREADFTGLLAYYRTFETREHAILARCTPTRYLGIGQSDPDHLGMWYIFISPQELQGVEIGDLHFGGRPAPGLRLRHTRPDGKGRPRPAVTYLDFNSDSDRQRVLADLLLDLGGPARTPWRQA